MESQEVQASNLAAPLIELADEFGAPKIWIHGNAYKSLVSYTQRSCSLLTILTAITLVNGKRTADIGCDTVRLLPCSAGKFLNDHADERDH